MASVPTAEYLVQIVHRYYPMGLESFDPRHHTSPETQRLRSLLEPARKELEAGRKPTKWAKFIEQLRNEFAGCIIWDTTPPLHEPCYRCRIYLSWVTMGSESGESVVALLSLLAPVYAIYAAREGENGWVEFPPLPDELQIQESRLAQLIESEFGFIRLSNDLLFTPVPDLVPSAANAALGEARLIDCLFTHNL